MTKSGLNVLEDQFSEYYYSDQSSNRRIHSIGIFLENVVDVEEICKVKFDVLMTLTSKIKDFFILSRTLWSIYTSKSAVEIKIMFNYIEFKGGLERLDHQYT